MQSRQFTRQQANQMASQEVRLSNPNQDIDGGMNFNENYSSCFFPQQLLICVGGTMHEVDSIIDITGPKFGQDQQFKLELCCACCCGRTVRFKRQRLMQCANEPLKNLAEQTIQMHYEGFEISGKDDVGVQNSQLSDFLEEVDIDMDDMESFQEQE